MPNYVINEIKARPEVLRVLLDADQNVTFNMLIPSPADDDPIFTAERIEFPGGMVGWSGDGYCPLDWNRAHWGTKWDAFDYETDAVEEGSLTFQTAWSPPMPVFQKLIEKFPAERIEFLWADEDMGHNLGHLVVESGDVSVLMNDEFSHEARERFACDMWSMDYDEWQAEYSEV